VTRRICQAIDLDPAAIAEYERRHRPGAPPAAVNANIRAGGILSMDIYRVADRLFMIMEVNDDFDPAALARADATDPAIRAWAEDMAVLQRPIRDALGWAAMTCIYRLADQP
jgi:L-rhamnose mutarotase